MLSLTDESNNSVIENIYEQVFLSKNLFEGGILRQKNYSYIEQDQEKKAIFM